MWWKFRKHRLALISAGRDLASTWSPSSSSSSRRTIPSSQDARNAYHAADRDPLLDTDGDFRGPFVYGTSSKRNLDTLSQEYADDTSSVHPIAFFVEGTPYKLWGLIPMDRHLFGVEDPDGRDLPARRGPPGPRHVLADRLRDADLDVDRAGRRGRSASCSASSFGGISGYLRRLDRHGHPARDRVPALDPDDPALDGAGGGAAPELAVLQIYFAITIILSLIGWTGLARVVRGRFLRCARRTS